MSLNNQYRILTSVLLFLGLLTPSLLLGQTKDSASFDLSPPDVYWTQVERVIEIGLRENPEIAALRLGESISESELRQVRLFPNPTLSVQLEGGRQGMYGERMLGIEMPLPLDGRRGAAVRTARASIEEIRFEIADRERLLRRAIRDAVTAVVAARLRRDFLKLSLELAERSQTLTSEAVDQGLRAPLELNKETVFLNGIRARREMAEADVTEAEVTLATLLGRESLTNIGLPESLPGVIHDDVADTLNKEDLLSKRPDVAASRARIRISEGLLGEARAGGRPTVDLMFGIREMKSGFPLKGLNSNGEFSPIEDRMRFTGVGMRIGIPIFNRNQGGISAATTSVERARRIATSAEIVARNEVSTAIVRLRRAKRSLEIMTRGVVQQARDNLRVIALSYEDGAISLDEFLRERRAAIDLELEFIEAARANAVAETSLLASLGVTNRCELTANCQKEKAK